jgi:hypothetical protein
MPYSLSLMPTESSPVLEPEKIYIGNSPDPSLIAYKLIKADGTPVEGTISKEQLGIMGATLTIEQLTPYLQQIIEAIASDGHISIDYPMPDIVNVMANGDAIQVGVRVSQFEDPADASYVYLYPEICIKNDHPTKRRHIMIVADTSSSMSEASFSAGSGIVGLKRMLPALFDKLHPENDEISLVTFSSVITPICHGTRHELGDSLTSSVTSMTTSYGTALHDAVLYVGDKEKNPELVPGHTTVLLITDGGEGSSKYKGTTGQVIAEYFKRFDGSPPRLIPIGLGGYYSKDFAKKCAIATNYGMIDATNQSQLACHIDTMVGALAYGVHISLAVGSSEPTHLGIVNYNTINKQQPLRVKKSELEAAGGLTISIGKHPEKISTDHFVTLPTTIQPMALIPRYLERRVREIYDIDPAKMDFNQKLDEIEALTTPYLTTLDEGLKEKLRAVLVILDQKRLSSEVHKIAALPRPSSEETLEATLARLRAERKLVARYPENDSFLTELCTDTAGMSITATLTRSIRSTGGITVGDPTESGIRSNSFTGFGSLTTSTLGGISLSLVGGGYGVARSAKQPRVDRHLDFAKLDKDIIVLSEFSNRETISIDLGAPYLAEAIAAITSGDDSIPILNRVMTYVAGKMPDQDLTKLGMPLTPDSQIDIQTCLTKGVGVCRHHSLFTAALLGQLAQTTPAPFPGEVKVRHYRAVNNNLLAHSCTILTQTSGSVTKHFIVDPTLNIYEEISTQADFERCIERFNNKGLFWFLRNFAKDNGFTYPESELDRPIGRYAINKLQIMALESAKVMRDLRDRLLIASGTSIIEQTDGNKEGLWKTLVEYGLIEPEETTEAQIARSSRETDEHLAELMRTGVSAGAGAGAGAGASASASASAGASATPVIGISAANPAAVRPTPTSGAGDIEAPAANASSAGMGSVTPSDAAQSSSVKKSFISAVETHLVGLDTILEPYLKDLGASHTSAAGLGKSPSNHERLSNAATTLKQDLNNALVALKNPSPSSPSPAPDKVIVFKNAVTQAISKAEEAFRAHRGNTFWHKHIIPWINGFLSIFSTSYRRERETDLQVNKSIGQFRLFKDTLPDDTAGVDEHHRPKPSK